MDTTNAAVETNTRTYLIADHRMGELSKKLDKLVRKAERLGCTTVSYQVVGTEDRPYCRNDEGHLRPLKDAASCPLNHTPVFIKFNVVEVTGTTPRLAGWSFVATLQHLQDDKGAVINMLRTVPSFEGKLPEKYRTATPDNCDHCGKVIRTRKDTFVVHNNETDEWKQVGRNCVASFIGGVNPQSVAASLDLLLEVYGFCSSEEGEGSFGGGAGTYRYGMDNFLSVTAMMVRTEGWVSRSRARADENAGILGTRATADLVLTYLNPPPTHPVAHADHMAWVRAHPVTDEDKAVAEKAMAYAREDLKAKETRSDYEHNLYVATVQSLVEYRTAGITASLIPYYLREVERQVLREKERVSMGDSKHMGAEGERLKMLVAKLLRVHTSEGFYGTTYILKLITNEGNVITWFTSANPELAVGAEVMLDGTVKKHGEYNGVKETVLSRCTIYTEQGRRSAEEKAAKKAAREAKKAAKAAK